jgi:hypothetical protein
MAGLIPKKGRVTLPVWEVSCLQTEHSTLSLFGNMSIPFVRDFRIYFRLLNLCFGDQAKSASQAYIDNVNIPFTKNFMTPLPDLWRQGLTYPTDDSKATQITKNVFVASFSYHT